MGPPLKRLGTTGAGGFGEESHVPGQRTNSSTYLVTKLQGICVISNKFYDIISWKKHNPHATRHITFGDPADQANSPSIMSACPRAIRRHQVCHSSTSNGCSPSTSVHAVLKGNIRFWLPFLPSTEVDLGCRSRPGRSSLAAVASAASCARCRPGQGRQS